ncbi:hypothetical protein TALC_01041 [Thermoplasmatales archaeon BRNA1]|nr:hypothetical protein TALC_01041 [Thermoplasmatales archaeon BRNA1]
MSRKQKKVKEQAVEVQDAYDDSERTLSVEDAHRDVVYSLPSQFRQMWVVYMTQMKRFTRQRAMWVMLVFLLLIPVVYFSLTSLSADAFGTTHVLNMYMAGILCLLPLMSMLIASISCGAMLPQEFNERTVYLSLPLPLDRKIFFIGKFMAGLTLTVGVISAAYGIAVFLGMQRTDVAYTADLFVSYIVSIAAVFNYCAFTYFLSSRSARGSSMLPLIMMLVIIPVICTVLAYGMNKVGFEAGANALGYVPVFATDMSMNMLGIPFIGITFSFMGIMGSAISMLIPGFAVGTNYVIMVAVSIALGLLFLHLGNRIIGRRDM